jgi:tubby-related protein 4
MHAFIELSNTARTDSIVQSLSWMNLIVDVPTEDRPVVTSIVNNQDGWLATGNLNHIVSVTYTSLKPNELITPPDRTNFNLRAHRSDIRLVSWNLPYQKLATVDEKGVIFVWVKQDNRWSLELINDRSHPVTDMCWSPDGRMSVICYEDGFILAGSVTGQRYWSTVLNNIQIKISAVTWLPDMSQ